MSYGRYYGPQARKDLHSWQNFNNNLNVNNLQLLSRQPQQLSPPSYPNTIRPPHFDKKPPQLKKKNTTFRKVRSCCEKFLVAFDSYCDTSTLHGLKYVGENRFSKPERVFWLIAFFVAVVLAIFFISNLFANYNDSPVIVGFSPRMMHVQNIPFPAITICSTNIAFRSRAEIIKRFGTPTEKLIIDDLCNTNTSNYEDPGSISWRTMERVILNITQTCGEMMIGCKWQGKTHVCMELINSVLTDDGYCCSFNKMPASYYSRQDSDQSNLGFPTDIVDWSPENGYPANSKDDTFPYRAFGRGVQQGLTLVLDVALHEYYCSTTNCFGFKILFHTPRESPKVADLGFLIEPGLETRIAVNVEMEMASDSIQSIDYRKRKCFFTNEKYLRYYKLYNAKNCLLECEANYTIAKCGCIPYFLPRDPDTKICDKSDTTCADEAKFVIERFGPEKLACDCLPGCSLITYQPKVISQGTLKAINNITFTEFLGNYTQKYFSENIAIVHFYFGVESFQVQIKTAMYGFSEFLSNTGGLLGLFLGFSCLSVVEIIYFLIIRGACVWCQNRRNKKQKQQVFVQ